MKRKAQREAAAFSAEDLAKPNIDFDASPKKGASASPILLV
ncbi:hypothetical protein [Rhizobium anhuiense]|nr:hypothetical protein [Rhizobium anhuiense]